MPSHSIVKLSHTITCKMTTKQVNYCFKHMQIKYNLFAHFKCIQIQRNAAFWKGAHFSRVCVCFFLCISWTVVCFRCLWSFARQLIIVSILNYVHPDVNRLLKSALFFLALIKKKRLHSLHVIEYEFFAHWCFACYRFQCHIRPIWSIYSRRNSRHSAQNVLVFNVI